MTLDSFCPDYGPELRVTGSEEGFHYAVGHRDRDRVVTWHAVPGDVFDRLLRLAELHQLEAIARRLDRDR